MAFGRRNLPAETPARKQFATRPALAPEPKPVAPQRAAAAVAATPRADDMAAVRAALADQCRKGGSQDRQQLDSELADWKREKHYAKAAEKADSGMSDRTKRYGARFAIGAISGLLSG